MRALSADRLQLPAEDVEIVAQGSPAEIRLWVHNTARTHRLRVLERPSDRFAKAATRLSDTDVELDEVEELLIALQRSHVLTQEEATLLQISYLR